jgi:hypothetical protein
MLQLFASSITSESHQEQVAMWTANAADASFNTLRMAALACIHAMSVTPAHSRPVEASSIRRVGP